MAKATKAIDIASGVTFWLGGSKYRATADARMVGGMVYVETETVIGGGWGPVRFGSPMMHVECGV